MEPYRILVTDELIKSINILADMALKGNGLAAMQQVSELGTLLAKAKTDAETKIDNQPDS